MDAIRVISSDIIKAQKSIDQKIDLTPWDLQFLLITPIKKGLIYQHLVVENDIQRLRESLSSALAYFPPLAGRLEITEHGDNIVSCSVTCNNAGVLFVHATIENICVVDIVGPTYVPHVVQSLFPFNGIKNYEGTSQPLLAVQVTELVDGVFIGINLNHVVIDGKSAWHFINTWAEISRGCCNQTSQLLTLNRWFPNGIQCPIRFPFTMEPPKNHSGVLSFLSSNDENHNLSERIFHFSKEKIAHLKTKANIEIGTNKISSLQALFTHLWRSVIRSKQLNPQEEVHYMFVIGARPRLVPPLREDYFGNAAKVGEVTMKVGELLEQGGFGKGAWEMNKMIALHSYEKLKNHYESWLKNPIIIRLSSVFNDNTLACGGSPWFDVYGNDFGWGKPMAVRHGTKLNGTVSVFTGIEKGSIDLQVCLPYKTLEAMGNDPDFMDVVSN